MKYLKLLVVATLFATMALPFVMPQAASALSRDEKIQCFKDWDGVRLSPKKKEKKYNNSKCAKDKDSNCYTSSVKEIGESGDQTIVQIAHCPDPREGGDGSGDTGGGTSGGDGGSTNDPALDPTKNPCKDASHCDLINRYMNPFINKFLAPLAFLAVIFGVIWGSIQYAMAGGDPQRTAAAKDHIQKALIALVAFLLLYAFLNWLMPGGLL